MKIHFIINSLGIGGAERVMILLANYFAKKNHEVAIITFNEPEEFKPNDNVIRIRLHGGNIKNHTLRSIKNLFNQYHDKDNRPDVIIPFMTRSNFIGIIVGKRYGIKTISSEHINHLDKTDFIGNLTRKYLYKFSDVLTVLTDFDKKFYKKRGVQVEVMPNPSTFNIYKEQIRDRKKIVLAIGNLNRYYHKGFDNLVTLIAPIFQKHPDWILKIVGGGQEGLKFLKTLVDNNGLSQQVVFEGYSNKVQELMRESEIFIMPSRFEGLPMVLIEAMSQGMACISYDCITGPSDIITHNVNGILVEDQNAMDMAEQLDILISTPELRTKLADNGIQSLDKFKIDVIYKKYVDIFHDILKL